MSAEDDVRRVELIQAKNVAFVRGAVLVGTVLLASVQWYALRQLDYVVAQGKDVAMHGQRLAVLDAQMASMRMLCASTIPASYDGPSHPVQEVKRR